MNVYGRVSSWRWCKWLWTDLCMKFHTRVSLFWSQVSLHANSGSHLIFAGKIFTHAWTNRKWLVCSSYSLRVVPKEGTSMMGSEESPTQWEESAEYFFLKCKDALTSPCWNIFFFSVARPVWSCQRERASSASHSCAMMTMETSRSFTWRMSFPKSAKDGLKRWGAGGLC